MYLSTNRLPWVDAARMFAMLTVVTAHCISFARLPNIDSFIYWIVAWELPLFTMLSGYVSQKGLYRITTWTGLWNHAIKLSNRMLVPAAMFGLLIQSSFIGFLDGKTLKPIIAMCVWLTLIALYILSKSNNGKFYAKILALAAIVIELHSKHMWYLSMLFCIMIVFSISNVICSKLKKTENYSALLYTLFVIIWGGLIEYCEIGDMGIYLIAGMLISKHGDKVKAFFESLWPFVVMPLLGLYLSMYLGDKIYFYDIPEKHLLSNGDIMTYFLRQVCGITWSLWFIWLFRRFYKKYDIFCYFGTLTLGIYIIHAYMLHIVRYIYKTFDYSQYSRFEAILIALLPAVILSSLSIALIHLFKRRKATKELLLGEY